LRGLTRIFHQATPVCLQVRLCRQSKAVWFAPKLDLGLRGFWRVLAGHIGHARLANRMIYWLRRSSPICLAQSSAIIPRPDEISGSAVQFDAQDRTLRTSAEHSGQALPRVTTRCSSFAGRAEARGSRRSAAAYAATGAVLVGSTRCGGPTRISLPAYVLYYSDEEKRSVISAIHWIIGLGAPVALIWHILRGRGTHSTSNDFVGPR